MSDERSPVSLNEWVLRAIPNVEHFYKPPILRVAFEPNRNDTEGLSVFRERYTAAAEVARSLPKRGDYHVVRLSVRELSELGLTVTPDPLAEGPRGHAIIPELSYPAFRADKRRLKAVQRRYAEMANRPGAIVYEPPAR